MFFPPLTGFSLKKCCNKRLNSEERTSRKRERLSPWEAHEFWAGRCPDCGGERLLEGPSGGLSVNVKCANENCDSCFNDMAMFGVERISDRSPNRPLELPSTGGPYR